MVCETGDVIPGDGEVVEGIASVDESAITGESAPVIRESGGDRSAVTGGTRVISDRIVVRITAEQGKTFVDRMIGLVENATRQKTPGEIALLILLSRVLHHLPGRGRHALVLLRLQRQAVRQPTVFITTAVLFSLLVCLIPTTIGGLLSAIGISSVSRLHQEERARPEREGRGRRRRHRRDAPGQDGHGHHGQPHGLRVLPGQGRGGERRSPRRRCLPPLRMKPPREGPSSTWRARTIP